MGVTSGLKSTAIAEAPRRVTMVAISVVFFGVRGIWRKLYSLLHVTRPGTCSVLLYHSVPRQFEGRFESQIKTLVRSYGVVDLASINTIPPNTHSVSLTFDDGFSSFPSKVVPILERFNVPATWFVLTEEQSARPQWMDGFAEPAERLLSVREIKTVPAWVTIGSHGSTHADLTQLSSEAALENMARSRRKLREELNREIDYFSFPFGRYNDSVRRLCRDAGYRSAFSVIPSSATSGSDDFVIGRAETDPSDWWLEFRLKASGAYDWFPVAISLVRRLRSLIRECRWRRHAVQDDPIPTA